MRRRFVISLAAIAVVAPGVAQEKGTNGAAADAALAWLALTDSGRYGESWTQAAQPFKEAISRSDWEQALTRVRKPLGEVTARTLRSATPTTRLPSAPPGEYVVIQYSTTFAAAPERSETVTSLRDADGSWRVSGYFIR